MITVQSVLVSSALLVAAYFLLKLLLSVAGRALSRGCWHDWTPRGITATGSVLDQCEKCGSVRVMTPDGHATVYTPDEVRQMNFKRKRVKKSD